MGRILKEKRMTTDQDVISGRVICPYKKKSWPKEKNGTFESVETGILSQTLSMKEEHGMK